MLRNTAGNDGLLAEPIRVLLLGADKTHGTMTHLDALADAFARRDVCLVAGLWDGLNGCGAAVATAAVRHAAPLILFGEKALKPCSGWAGAHGGQFRQPVPVARIWDECFDPKTTLYSGPRSGGVTMARRISTSVVVVTETIFPDERMLCPEDILIGWNQQMVLRNGNRSQYPGADRFTESFLDTLRLYANQKNAAP